MPVPVAARAMVSLKKARAAARAGRVGRKHRAKCGEVPNVQTLLARKG